MFVAVAVLTIRLSSGAATLTDPCSSPGWNVITCENSKPGTPQSTWGAGGAGDTTLQGFPTDISVDHGQTISFKITDTNGGSGVGGAYHIDIYRVGYYQGNGARLQATISSPTATAQPACTPEAPTGLVDCGNWTVSASWAVPATAVSGLYFANLVRNVSGANSHIYFIVRDDERHAPILFQTSDETWQAYNAYGGNSLYVGTAPTSTGRAYKVSYNRPLTTGNNSPRNEPLYAEYPMIRFLERNGYDVSYFSDVDTARSGAEILNHKSFMSVGHDEYWSAEQRNNVVAARNAGVNLAFFSGNEIFWKTRFAASITPGAQAWRTIVCYKESKETTVPIDPADPPTSTGAWRDPRFGAPADGAKPENAVSGQMYMVDAIRDDAISVPYAYSQLRFWNNTSISHLTTGQTATLPTGTLGYEWDEDLDNGSRPAGLIDMSSTTVPVTTLVTDSTGQAEGSGNATHHLTLYRASSGALVFGAGTVQWSFGLDDQHTQVQDSSNPAQSADMQQATVNLLADMGTQPATLITGLVPATKSTDTTPPTSTISYPTSTTLLNPTQSVTVTGTASDTGGVVAGVEVSTDGGTTWHPATGTTNWSYTFVPGSFGQITIKSRATDDSANLQTAPASVTVPVGSCPCNIFGQTTPTNTSVADPSRYELGVKFRSDAAGFITGIRFYKGSGNTGTHVGHLWTGSGTLLGSATFTGETATGWQQVNFASPIAINPNTTYVASYFAPVGNYAADRPYFATSGVDVPPLHALADGVDGPNGVYASGGGFPNNSFQSSNYYVDVVFNNSNPPTVNTVTPTAGAQGVATSTGVTVAFSQPMDSTTINTSTITLRDPSNVLVPATVTYDTASMTATLTPSQPLALSTTYTAKVTSGSAGVKNTSGTSLAADDTWTFTTATPATCPCTIFPASATPTITSSFDTTPNELGVKFRSDESGYIRGIRFYKGAGNTGTHIGHLWSSAGAMLAEITFTNESAGGWQQVDFPRPVAITANTTYVASYYAPNGGYALDRPYFSTGVDRSPLHGLADGVSGPNGVFASGGGFPTQGSNQANYWVDVVFDTNGSDTTPPIVSSVSPSAGATGIATSRTVAVAFNEPMDPLSLTTTSVQLRDPSNAVVPATVSSASGTQGAILTPSSPLALSTTYTLVVKGGAGGVTDTSGNALAADYTSTFVTGAPATCPCNLLDSSTPTVASSTDTSPTEVGVKFRSDVDGYITGIRFYKGLQNTGTHVGHLWSSTGTMMGSATFTGETSTGWQLASFSSPVAIRANTTYIASYFAPNGGYALDRPFFTSWLDRPPLHALAEGVEGSNGVYASGQGFPNQAFDTSASNYWVDPVFDTSSDHTPPTVTSTSPAANATGIFRNTTVNAVFSEALNPNSIGSSTFVLRNAANTIVPATVTYNAATTTATLTPSALLTPGATYSVTISGGSSGVKDLSGNALVSDFTWSFTISSDTTAPTTTIGCNADGCASWFNTSPVTVTLSAADNAAGSGVDTTKYTIDGSDPTTSPTAAIYAAPFTVTTTTTIRYSSTDKAGNVEAPGSTQVRIDTTPPSTPSLSFGAFSSANATGSTVYFNPAVTGGFTVTGASSDAESGVASVNYPSLGTGWSGTGGAYTFAAGASDPIEPNNVTATNNAGLSSGATSFTVTPDATAPTTTLTCNAGACPTWSTSSPVTIALNATDIGSGVAATYYTTDGSDPSPVHGSIYVGGFTVAVTTTIKFRSYDKVGNAEAIGTQQVRIDTTPPSAPALTFGNLSGAALSGGILWFNPATGGTATVTATSTDAESGVSAYSYPSLGSGWSGTGGAYSFGVGAADPSEPNNVTATNGAGLTSAPTSFTVNPDSSAPSTSIACNSGACSGWFTTSPVSVALSATDTGSGVKRILYSTDGTTPSIVYTTPLSITATTTVEFAAVDNVGNQETLHTTVVQVDTTPPSAPVLTFSPISATAVSGTTVYYSPAAAGSFTVNATSTDPESGIATYTYPSFSSGSGWNNSGGAYSFGDGATDPGPGSVTATDNAGLVSAPTTFTPVSDGTAPTTTIACTGGCAGWHTTSPVTITLSATDSGSGLDRTLYSTDGSAPSLLYTAPFTLAATATVKFASYDRVGNVETTQSQLIQIDTTAPGAPNLAFSALTNAAISSGVLYFNPAGTGGFTLTPSSNDAESGVASYSYPSLGSGWTNSNGAYTFAAGATDPVEPNNVTATNNAGLTSGATSFTVTADTSAPVASATCNGNPCTAWYTSAPVTLALSATDTGSGIDRILYSTDGSAPSTVYTAPITIASTTTVKFAAVDKVGNTSGITSTPVQIDTTAPTAPSLSFSGLGGAAVTGGVLYFNPAAPGGFTVTASSTDAQSGVDHYTYPSLGSGWSNSGGSYAFATAAADPTEPNNVTATNGAGLTSAPTSFTVTADTTAPATIITCNSASCSPWFTSSPVTVTLTATDAGSGVNRILYSTDGSAPSLVYSTPLSIASTTTIRYAATDKVGNVEATGSQLVQIDTTAPSTPTLTLTESSPFEFINSSTLYYNPTGTNSATFGVGATTGDAESGITKVTFPAIAGMTGGGDVGSSPYQTSYSWTAPTATSGSQTVTARNNAGLTASASFTLTADTSAPIGGSITYTDGYNTTGSVTVTTANGSDAGSGLNASSAVLQRDSIALTNGTCGTFAGNWTAAVSPDTSLVSGTCYRYRYLISDNVGNTATYTSASVVKVDSSAPSTPALTLSTASATGFIAGSTVYYSNSAAGNFTVAATTADGESGIKEVTFPAISGMTGGGADTTNPYSTTYNWTTSTSTSGSQNVNATNNALLTSANAAFTLTADNTAPTLTIASPAANARIRNGAVLTPSVSDAGSGIKSVEFRYCAGTGNCQFNSATMLGTSTTAPYTFTWNSQPADGTYQIVARATDNVGNQAVVQTGSSTQVTIDNTPPYTALSLVTASASYLNSGTVYFANTAGGFTLHVDVLDPQPATGVKNVVFPAIATTGWTGAASTDTTAPYENAYTFPASASTPTTKTIVTSDNAGNTQSDTVTFVKDQTAPTVTLTGPAGGTRLTNGATVSATASDAGSGIRQVEFRYCPGATCTFASGTTIGTATSAPYTVAWNSQPPDGTYTIAVQATDNVGNTATDGTSTVTLDNSAPTTTLSVVRGTRSDLQYFSAGTLYYNPAATGDFTLSETATDPAGVTSVAFPAIAQTGFNGTAKTATSAPYVSNTYTFDPSSVTAPPPAAVVATDGVGNHRSDSVLFVLDANAPTGGSINYPDGYTAGSVTIATNPGTDAGSGVDATTGVLERQTAALTGGTCGTLGTWSPVTSPDTVPNATCAQYRYRVSDHVGNQAIYTSPNVVKSDTTAPSAPALTFGSFSGASTNGSIIYFNPSVSGGFTVTPSSTDAESGVSSYGYPSLGSGWSNTNGAYTFAAGAADPTEPNNVTATNGAGLTSAPTSFTVTADSTAPATSASCNGGSCAGWFTSSPVSLTLSATDSGSGVDRILYSTDGSAPSTVYTGALSIAATATVKFAAVDKVGNVEAVKSQLVQVDTTAPSAPSLAFGGLSGATALNGGVLFFNPAGTGGFTVTPSSTDAESGVATYGYPSLGSGWTNTNGAYTFSAGASDPAEPNNVTASNNAGLTSNATSFTVSADTTAPTTTASCSGGCAGWHTTTPTVTLSATDGGAGVARIVYSIDGSAPSLPYTGPITLTSTATVKFAATDKVGNGESTRSQLVQVDTTAPTAPALTISPNVGTAVTGSTVFFNPAAAGSFTVDASSTDAESGVASYSYPSLGLGWTNTGGAYSFAAGALAPAPANVTATNNAGLVSPATSFTLTADTTAPVTTPNCNGGACTGWFTSTPVSLALSATDGGSGLDRILYSTDGSAPSLLYTTPLSITSTTTVKYAAYDRVGNLEATKTQFVQVDTTAPSAPGLAFGGLSGSAVTSGVLYFNPNTSGGFTVTPSSTDAESGVSSYGYPSLGSGWSNSNGTYTFNAGATDPAEPNNVTATNNAGLTSTPTSFTVTPDGTAPTATIACDGGSCTGWHTTSPVSVTLSATDGGSGVDRILYSTDGSAPSTVYGGPFTIASTASVKFSAIDKVGNTTATASTPVQIDTTAPTTPALSFSALTNASASGPTVYYRSSAAGGFTVNATSSDPESAVASYAYPSLGSGWSNTAGAYSFAAGAVQPLSASNVTATNNAGLTSAPAPFTVLRDDSAPTTAIRCNGGACGGGYATSSVLVTLVPTDSAGSGVVQTLYTLDGSDPSPLHGTVYLGGFSVSSTTTVKFRSYDAVGNEEAIGSQVVNVDTTPPSAPVVSLTAPSASEYASATTLYYNPSGTNSGSFSVSATAADPESSISKINFPAISGLTGGGDTTAPFSSTYAWNATTTASGSQTVTAYNGAGLTSTASFSLVPDTTTPAGGSVSYPDGFQSSGVVTITTTDGTDGGSGIDPTSRALERQTAPLTNGSCQTWGLWTTVASPDSVSDAMCARYRYRVSDRVGNQQIYTSTNVVKVDAGAPTTPALTVSGASPNEFVSGTTVYYNPSGSNTGSFTINAPTSAASGIARVTFPALTGLTGGGDVTATPYTATYGWTNASTASGTQTVTARSNAGGTSTASFTVTPDTGAPTGQTAALVGGPWFTTTSIPVATTNGSDAISGVAPATALLERASATLTNGTCGTFGAYGGSYTSPDTTVLSGNCYRYRYSIADKVGNRSTPVETSVAMVDTSAPTAPALAFSALNHASVTGSTVFYNPNISGTFTVGASSTDPQSGVASYAFPAFGSGWTGAAGAYTFAASAADPAEPNNVTATNTAGLTSSPTGFTVTADGDAPTGGSIGYTDGYRTSASVAITLANGADALSGVDASSALLQRASATMTEGSCGTFGPYTTIATVPALSYNDTTVTSGNCYAYQYLVSDKVGNTATWTTAAVAKIDTNAPTGTLTDPGANLRQTINLASVTGDTGGSGVATVTYQRSDPSGWMTIPQGWDTRTVADGLYDLRVVVTDRAGNTTTSTAVTGRRVDNTPPTANLPDPGANLRRTVTLAATGSDSGSGIATVTYQRSDPTTPGNWMTIPAAWDTTSVADGTYDLRVVIVDVAGNQAISTVTGRLVDNTAPSATMGSLSSAIRGTVTLGSSATDSGSGIASVAYERQQVGTSGWVATPATFDTSTVADGDYDFHVIATDVAGNSTTSAPVRTHIDNTSPRPTSVSPANGAGSVSANTTVTATFPRAMLASSINASSFTLTGPSGTVPATVSYDSVALKATLTPTAALDGSTSYTAKLTTAVTASDGASLYQSYTWTFSPGVIPPTVTAKTPSAGATGVAVTVAPTATFSRAMDATTINGTTVTLSGPSGAVAATVAYDSGTRIVTITPSAALAAGTAYTVQLSSGINSQDGVALSTVTWSFTTLASAPTVVSTTPASGATGVPTASTVAVTFNRDMKASTLTTSTITLTGPSGSVAATVAYDSPSKTATLTPTSPLAGSTAYTATVSGTVQAIDGTPMGSASTWTFTTTSAPEVRSTSPAAGTTGVSMSVVPTVVMSKALDSATVTTTNVKLIRPDTSLVPISVSYNSANFTITITPSSPLDYSGTFTIRLETGITAGSVPLAAQFNSTFTTTGTGVATRVDAGSTTPYTASNGNVFSADTGYVGGTARTVTNTITGTTDPTLYKTERYGTWQYAIPVPNGTYDVKLHFVELTNTACNTRVFSVDVLNTPLVNDISNLDIFCEVGANKPDIKTISNVPVTARSMRLKAVVGVGTPEIAAIEIIPHVTATASTPAAGATGVSVGTTVSAVFSQAMDATSLTSSTVTLSSPGGAVTVTVAYDSAAKTVTLTPSAPLGHSTTYTARLDGTIRDAYGMTMGSAYTWTFTTG